jgi:ATP-dependent metalloprotease
VAHSDDELPYLSGAKKDEIESEIRRFVDEGWGRVKGLMQDNIGDLHKVSGGFS